MYPHSQTLNTDYSKLPFTEIYICMFSIIVETKFPFVKYILKHSLEQQMLTFPKIQIQKELILNLDLEQQITLQLGTMFTDCFKKAIPLDIKVRGFYEWDKNIYLFVQLMNNTMDYYPWGILISEILHTPYICNVKMDSIISHMFQKNPFLCHFYNTKETDVYENPEIGYYSVGNNEGVDNLQFIQLFGANKHSQEAPFGPYYYFTNDFNLAVKQAGWTVNGEKAQKYDRQITDNQGKYLRGGMVRFALFVGKMTYIRYPEELTDKNNTNTSWATHYDSCYVGTTVFNEKNSLVIIKNHNQQYALASYTLNMNALGEKWNPLCNYHEMPLLVNT